MNGKLAQARPKNRKFMIAKFDFYFVRVVLKAKDYKEYRNYYLTLETYQQFKGWTCEYSYETSLKDKAYLETRNLISHLLVPKH